MTPTRRIDDPEVLKALAHPVRQRLYRLLAQLGPATVGTLAAKLGADPGRISYHLRELGRHGFIDEAPELAKDRRERWWRALPGTTSWSTADFTTPEGRAVAETLKARLTTDEFDRLSAYQQDEWPAEWTEVAVATQTHLRLTPAELNDFAAELQEVFTRWAARKSAQPAGDDGREPVFVFLHAFPERP